MKIFFFLVYNHPYSTAIQQDINLSMRCANVLIIMLFWFKGMWVPTLFLKRVYLTKIPIESSRENSVYSIYIYGALDKRVIPIKWWEFI